MSKVYIAEKPSFASRLASFLGCNRSEQGYIQSEDGKIIITWGFGHMLRLAYPGEIRGEWKRWTAAHLPIIPDEFPRVVTSDDQLAVIKMLTTSSGVQEIVVATDAGREGEGIGRWILEACLGSEMDQVKVTRLWATDLSDKGLQVALDNLRPIHETDGLFAACYCRQIGDWLVGLNMSRAMTIHHDTLLNVGRVQTPTLAMMVQRHRDIRQFVKEIFYEVHIEDEGVVLKSGRYDNASDAEDIANALPDLLELTQKRDQTKSISPPPPFDLTRLQAEANKTLGLTAEESLLGAQILYENGFISYPRSDCAALPESMAEAFEGFADVMPFKDGYWPQKIIIRKKFFNDQLLTDHYAIVPTGKKGMPTGHQSLYELIWQRLAQILSPDKEVRMVEVESHGLNGKVTIVNQRGWDQKVKGFVGEVPESISKNCKIHQGETEPPKYFNDGSLLNAMKHATTDDDEFKAFLKGGLGTAATRTGIIKKLIECGYVIRKKKNLDVSTKGIRLIEAIPKPIPELLEPTLTGIWESMLSELEEKPNGMEACLLRFKDYTKKITPLVFDSEGGISIGTCQNGHAIYLGRKKIRCECGDVWLEINGHPLTEDEAISLLNGDTLGPFSFKKKESEETYQAKLVFEDGKVNLLFDKRPEVTVGPCPKCQKEVRAMEKAFGCTGYPACKFIISRSILNKKLTDSQASQLLKGKLIGPFSFTSEKKQKTFSAKLKLDGERIVFSFN